MQNWSDDMLSRIWLSLIIFHSGYSLTLAQLPTPRLDRIAPLGGMAGSSVDVEIQGGDIEEAQLVFENPAITASPIEGKERWFKVAIGEDVPEGTLDARVVGKYGVSNPRLFAVAAGIADVSEKEPNNSLEQAQSISIGTAIAGVSDGNDQDIFRLSLVAGARVTIDCLAMRLDSQLDATLSIKNANGKVLTSNSDYFGRDPFIDFLAVESGDYFVVLNDLSYRGGLPYRLVVSDRPFVENAYPRIVKENETLSSSLLGRNFGATASLAGNKIADLELATLPYSFTVPSDILELGRFRFLEHPTAYSMAPTAATCTVDGFQVRPMIVGRASLNTMTFLTTDIEPTLEKEPNDQSMPQPIDIPIALSGRFDQPRDADWYEFIPKENGSYSFDVYCERINGQADPYLVVFDQKGNRIQELDDFGHRINAFDGHLRDPAGTINLNAGTTYRLLVQDRYQRGGARYQYALIVRLAKPDFFVAAIHSQNPGPAGCTIWRGGASYFDIVIHQTGGYNGPVTITADGLPPGLHSVPTTLGLGSGGTFVIWADRDAPELISGIRLLATGIQDGNKFVREVRPYTRVWNQGDGTSRPMRDLTVATRDTAPFAMSFMEPHVTCIAGKKVQAKIKLDRLWPSFQEPLNVLPLSWPGNFRMDNVQFSGATNELNFDIEVQAGTKPGEYSLAVLGQGQVPFSKNPDGKDTKNVLVSLPSTPLTIIVTAP